MPSCLPGERVRARVYRNHKNFSEADLVEVLAASPDRVAPRCAIFGRCGGCQYQHFAYAEQLAWKRRQVAELLEHMAGVVFPVEPVMGSPREFGYRSKITPHFAVPRAPAFPIGFLRQGTRFDLVDVPRCEIATDAINEKLTGVRAGVRARAADGEFARGATLLLRDAGGTVTTDFEAVIVEEVALARPGAAGPLRLKFRAHDFFQNNPFILPAFVDHVRAEAAATGARFLVDAYCGSGLFALGAAADFARVTGVELSATSVAFARENATANGIANATFIASEASALFARARFSPGGGRERERGERESDGHRRRDRSPAQGLRRPVPAAAAGLSTASRGLRQLRPCHANARPAEFPGSGLSAGPRAALRSFSPDPPSRVRDHLSSIQSGDEYCSISPLTSSSLTSGQDVGTAAAPSSAARRPLKSP